MLDCDGDGAHALRSKRIAVQIELLQRRVALQVGREKNAVVCLQVLPREVDLLEGDACRGWSLGFQYGIQSKSK